MKFIQHFFCAYFPETKKKTDKKGSYVLRFNDCNNRPNNKVEQ